jgi:outer membrane cobalamin receptor
MRFGAAASRLSGRYDYEDEVEFDLLFDLEGAPAQTSRSRSIHVLPQGRQIGLFATLRYDWTDRVATELGLRWDSQSLPDSETLGPRLGILYAFSDDTVLRASWGRFSQSQAINELQISDGVDAFLEPQRSDHVVLGVEHTFDNGVDMRVEAYDKSMKDIRPRFENLLNPLILLPELKPDRFRLAPSAARARGIEVTFEGPVGPLQWWSTYSRSRVRDRVQGQDVPRSWDQTHALSSGFNWDSAKWNASVGLIYRSGWPTTRVALDDSGVIPIATVAERNVERTDFFRSVDFRVTRKIALARSSLAVSFELTNAFGRTNPCCVEFEIGDEEEAGLLVLDELDYLPRIPSIGLLWKF